MNCDVVLQNLGPYLDGELQADVAALDAHLSACPACAEELESLRSIAAELAPLGSTAVPDTLWASIENQLGGPTKVRRPSPVRASRWRLFTNPMAAAASVLLVVGLGVVGLGWLGGGTSIAKADTIDFGVLLDALPLDGRKAFRKFLMQYDAKETTARSARRHAPDLSFAIPASLPGGFRLEQVYALRFGNRTGVAAAYSRDTDFLATIFHPPVRLEEFGSHKDYPCVIGKHRGHKVVIGEWKLIHFTDPTTCHCILSRLSEDDELPIVTAAVVPNSTSQSHNH